MDEAENPDSTGLSAVEPSAHMATNDIQMATLTAVARREYGTGGITRRKDGLFVGTIEAGWTPQGTRRRLTVSGKTKSIVQRKLRDKRIELERDGAPSTGRATVKTWSEQWLPIKEAELSPKGYSAYAVPVRKWIVPTIGHRRLADLTPGDVRLLEKTVRTGTGGKPNKGSTAAGVQRVLMTMLREAILEGHTVPQRILLAKPPQTGVSDRQGMTLDQGLACLDVASRLPHGSRWLATLLYGMRQGECLGLTWDAIDFDAGECGEITIEWQLQAFPYRDRRDKSLGFRVPAEMESRHLVDAWHLKRPKSKAGYRIAPLLPFVRDALLAWQEVAPENPYNLVWPTLAGRPANGKNDLTEWHAIQGTAEVGHPAGRYYHVHECRNFASTMLGELGVDDFTRTALLGHTTASMSDNYRNKPRAPLQAAITQFGKLLGG